MKRAVNSEFASQDKDRELRELKQRLINSKTAPELGTPDLSSDDSSQSPVGVGRYSSAAELIAEQDYRFSPVSHVHNNSWRTQSSPSARSIWGSPTDAALSP